ncbi:HEPN domain-containing protein [Pseudomonas sp. NPDC077186]|uniref:ApeA N-terminal domain 1-containing protein n=1 Tax=Pseudomonas sp. NPDC077186 TaxID=3364421 RepID=UPI0037C6532C
MKKTKGASRNRYLGTYQVSGDKSLVGELELNAEGTVLRVHADERPEVENVAHVKGIAYTGDYITLIDCLSQGVRWHQSKDGSFRHHADLLPHYVAIGSYHLDPEVPCIKAIHFTATDLHDLFYDFDAFGHVTDASPIIDSVLAERRRMRPVKAGDHPQVFYYTGKDCLIEVPTSIGKISVHHRPSYSLGGPDGVYIKNRMVVSIEPSEPATFSETVQRMYDISCFLSIIAGRAQGIKHIQLETTQSNEGIPHMLSVFPSFPWKTGGKGTYYKPHPADVPLDPIRAPEEFRSVLANWIERHASWHTSRWRCLGCLRKANDYDFDRLVAAANMFDILPAEAVPAKNQLSPELAEAKLLCKAILKKLPKGVERDSVLGALGRMGQPSLPKKVVHRATFVERQLGTKFPDLAFVVGIAVKLRNYFVHGSLDGLEYEKLEPFLPFLTDALEFVFAASDLIEAGWNAQEWSTKSLGSGHSFTRFLAGYDYLIGELRVAVTPAAIGTVQR